MAQPRALEDRYNPLAERAVFTCIFAAVMGAFVGWKIPTAPCAPAVAFAAGAIALHIGLDVKSHALSLLGGLSASATAMAVATTERNHDARSLVAVAILLVIVTAFVARKANGASALDSGALTWISSIMGLSAVVSAAVFFLESPSWLAIVPIVYVAINYATLSWATKAESVAAIRRRRLPLFLAVLPLIAASFLAIGTSYFFAYLFALHHSTCMSTLIAHHADDLRRRETQHA